jgi:protease I
MAHELTHLVQASLYPAMFSDYPTGDQMLGPAYKQHPAEREARWASIDILLRINGPTAEFWRAMHDLFGDELRQSRDHILGLVQKYKDRILAYSGSLMTADAIARRLGLTEKAIRAFMELVESHEGRLETVAQKVSTAHRRILMLVAPTEFYEPEYFAPRRVFAERGMEVKIATDGNKAIGAQGTTIETDLDIVQADEGDFDALFVVGGQGMVGFSNNRAAQRIVRKFVRAGKPVAMICHAPLLAAKSKSVVGRQITGWSEIRPEMVAAGAKWTGMPVERDGDFFTAASSEDAESLADILARRLDGAPTLVEAMLNEEASMRKLAKLWKMAAAIGDGPISDEEAERWLKEFEGQEFEEKDPVIPVVLPPPPAPKPTPAPVPRLVPTESPKEAVPDPETRKHRKRPQGEWNIAIELVPPTTDGSWPTIPEMPPVGFPFSPEDLADGSAIRALFQKPETWEALKEMAAHPKKRGLIQSYLVPAIVLAIGKAWWNINKHRKNIGSAPFGLFPSEEYKRYQSEEVALEETDAGRAFIAIINWRVAKILQFYLATGAPSGNLDGYIYDALNRRMTTDAGKRQGFEVKLKPVCAYCRRKRVIETTPPVLTETVKHQVQEQGSTRQRQLYQCPTCADLIDTKEKDLRLKEQGTTNAEESLREIGQRLSDLEAQLKHDPDNKDLATRARSLMDMREALAPQVTSLVKERDELREDLTNRRLMLSVPYSHLACIREDCSGQTVPLTFVEWKNPFWKTPEGVEARRQMASVYGITETPKQEQNAEDTRAETISETAGRFPPEWMWSVPFRCPFEHGTNKERNIVFTPREAFGQGKRDTKGARMGGLFLTAPRTTIWWKPMSLEREQDPEAEGERQRVEEMRNQTGVDLTTDSASFLRAQEQKQENIWLADRLREDIFRQRESFLMTRGKLQSRAPVLRRQMFDALLEWAYVHPIHLVEFFGSRSMSTKQPAKTDQMPVGTEPVVDEESGEVREHLGEKNIRMSPGQKERITSSIIQLWFSKVLELPKGLQLLQGREGKGGKSEGNYLTIYETEVQGKTQKIDGVHPDGFFVATVRQGAGGQLEAVCDLQTTSRDGRAKVKGKPTSLYGKVPWMALVLGIWDYDGPESGGRSIPKQEGSALIRGKTSRLDEMEAHNSFAIRFDPSTQLKEGDKVIVQALFMPRTDSWPPNKFVSLVRQGLQWDLENAKAYYAAIRRRQHPKPGDEEILAVWAKRLREAKTAGKLKEFYADVKQRLAQKETLTAFEKNLLQYMADGLSEEIGL